MDWAHKASLLGMRLVLKPKGSHAHVAENRIRTVKDALSKLLQQYPEHTLSGVLVHVCSVLNDLPGTGGFSP